MKRILAAIMALLLITSCSDPKFQEIKREAGEVLGDEAKKFAEDAVKSAKNTVENMANEAKDNAKEQADDAVSDAKDAVGGFFQGIKDWAFGLFKSEPDEPSEWAKSDIKRAREEKLLPESLDKKYKQDITREEICDLVVPLYESFRGSFVLSHLSFSDTSNNNVMHMASIGIIIGSDNNMFKPNDALSRQEAAAVFVRLIENLGYNIDPSNSSTISDLDEAEPWARDYINRVVAAKIMFGIEENKFDPNGTLSREQCVVILMRVWDLFDPATIPDDGGGYIEQEIRYGSTNYSHIKLYVPQESAKRLFTETGVKDVLIAVYDAAGLPPLTDKDMLVDETIEMLKNSIIKGAATLGVIVACVDRIISVSDLIGIIQDWQQYSRVSEAVEKCNTGEYVIVYLTTYISYSNESKLGGSRNIAVSRQLVYKATSEVWKWTTQPERTDNKPFRTMGEISDYLKNEFGLNIEPTPHPNEPLTTKPIPPQVPTVVPHSDEPPTSKPIPPQVPTVAPQSDEPPMEYMGLKHEVPFNRNDISYFYVINYSEAVPILADIHGGHNFIAFQDSNGNAVVYSYGPEESHPEFRARMRVGLLEKTIFDDLMTRIDESNTSSTCVFDLVEFRMEYDIKPDLTYKFTGIYEYGSVNELFDRWVKVKTDPIHGIKMIEAADAYLLQHPMYSVYHVEAGREPMDQCDNMTSDIIKAGAPELAYFVANTPNLSFGALCDRVWLQNLKLQENIVAVRGIKHK